MQVAWLIVTVALALVPSVGSAPLQTSDTYRSGSGIENPKIRRNPRPNYTRAAKDAHIQGVVGLEMVVLADGKVGEVRITRSLDSKYGLDQEAIRTVKNWRFQPARKDGKPVAVWVDVELSFTLK